MMPPPPALMIPGVALGLGEEPRGADLAGDLRRGFALVPVVGKLCAEGAVDVGLRGVLRNVQGVDGVGYLRVHLGLRVRLTLVVGLALDLQRVARVLERGHQGPGEVQVPQGLPRQQLPGGVPAPGGCVGNSCARNEGVHLRGVVIGCERYSDLVEDGRLQPGPRHVCAQVDSAHGRSNGGIRLCAVVVSRQS